MFHKNKATFICTFKLLPLWFYYMYSFFILPSSLLTVESRFFLVDQATYFLSIMRNGGCAGIEKSCLRVMKKVSHAIQFPPSTYVTYL